MVYLVEDWERELAKTAIQVFPPRAHVGSEAKTALPENMLRGSRSLKEPRSKRRDAHTGSVRLRMPTLPTAKKDDKDDEVSDAGSLSGAESSSSGLGDCPPPPSPPPATPPLVDPAEFESDDSDHGAGALRECRMVPFGPFSLSKIVSKGVHVGWGANCGRHWDARSALACKRQLRCLGGVTEEKLDECNRLCKQWLLLGLDVPPSGTGGKRAHLKDIRREDIEPRDHASLEHEAAVAL